MAGTTFSSVSYTTHHAPKGRIAGVQDPTGEALPVQVKAGESILHLRARAAIHFNVDPVHIYLALGNEENLDDECVIILGISGCDHVVQVVVRRDTPLQAIAREARRRYLDVESISLGFP